MIATTARAVWAASDDTPEAESVLAGLKKSASLVYENEGECLLLIFSDNSCLEITPTGAIVHASPIDALNESYKAIACEVSQ